MAEKKISEGGLRWIFVSNNWILNKLLWQKGILGHLRINNFDEVIFLGNIYYLSTWFALGYLKFKKTRISFWTHGVTSDEKGLKWFVRKYFYNCAQTILLYGENAKKSMIRNGFPEHKLKVVYNSLDYETQLEFRNRITSELIAETKEELFKKPNLPYLVFVGRLTPQKKLNMIIKAVEILKNNHNLHFNVLFVGKGPSEMTLKNEALQLNLSDNIHFYGACYDEERLSQLIGSADICVSPGEVGLTAMTALGYGTPVISHDDFNNQMPEYEAIVPGLNGDLFKYDSVEDLAEKIKNWFLIVREFKRIDIQKRCFQIIDQKYNPINQANIIKSISA